MGWETTRNLRFYPKNGNLDSIDIASIIEGIIKTARSLSSQIVYSIDDHEKCYNLKFNSSKLSGEVVFDKNKVEVWDLLSFEDGGTNIGNISTMADFKNSYYEIALFTFDQIKVRGKQSKLDFFYKEFLPYYEYLLSEHIMTRNEYEATINMIGFYTANNQHNTGNSKRRKKRKEFVCLVTENEFQENYTASGLFEDVIMNRNRGLKINELIQFLDNFEYENIFEGLESIDFLYENRMVKKVEWMEWQDKKTNPKKGHWQYRSSDWWDNCVNPKWKDFKEKKKYH